MIKRRGYFFFFILTVFLANHPLSHAATRRGPIIIGVGGGYSFFLDSGLKSYDVYRPKLIYFSEQLELGDHWDCYVQYFPWRGFGFQLEFDHQRAKYRSDLKWYGTTDATGKIIEIDYFEEPYVEKWSLSSITASIIYALTLREKRWRPYVSAGFGYYFSSGDQDRFYHRARLGPEKNGNLVKLGLGVKYQISPQIGINLSGVGGTVWRGDYGYRQVTYVGADQFVYEIYEDTGKIVRSERSFVNSFTFLGFSLSLEFTL